MNLRQLTRCAGWVIAALLLPFAAVPAASAAAPFAKTAAPGYYRMMIGSFEVTALLDGTFEFPIVDLMTNTTPARVRQALARAYLKDPVETSVNAYLINTGDKLVMIDAGAGTFFGPTGGRLVANLMASGYQPEQIDEIYITHMHSDHAGGLVSDGKPAFPNAIVRADRRDADMWLDKAKMEAAPKEAREVSQAAMAAIKPYVVAGRFKPFDGATQLVSGVNAVPAYGHTPGHTVYMVESQGQRLVVWGDLMHVGAVQFPEPAVTVSFDVNSKAAAFERAKQYAEAARRGYWVAAAHLPFPGIGHLRVDGKGYDWIPANYTANR